MTTQTLTQVNKDTTQAAADKLNQAAAQIAALAAQRPYISIELCGTWLWIHGTRRDDKEFSAALKAAGFKYSGKKMKWYLPGSPGFKRRRGSNTPMNQIRTKYGSRILKEETAAA